MDEATAKVLLDEMRSGKRVVVVVESLRAVQAAFIPCAGLAQDGEQVRRANGEQAIYAVDGESWVKFRLPSWCRGMGADLVVVNTPIDLMCVVAASGGQVVMSHQLLATAV